ncbi:MAG: DsrE family protein [Acidimicrobiia bacterium]
MGKTILFVVNDPPYGTERAYNAFRLAGSIAKRGTDQVKVFLMGDAVGCAVAGQILPDGYYKLDRMLASIIRHGGDVACCGTCMDARGIGDQGLIEGARRSTLEGLTDWTLEADKIVTF